MNAIDRHAAHGQWISWDAMHALDAMDAMSLYGFCALRYDDAMPQNTTGKMDVRDVLRDM